MKTAEKNLYLGEQLIHQEVSRLGPLHFERFTDLALYHPQYGYYSQTKQQRGRGGDYFTSLQVSSLFPDIFVEALIKMRESLGSDQFTLIEVGSGDGEFLGTILDRLKEKKMLGGVRAWVVEKSRVGRDRIWKRLSRYGKCEVVAELSDIEWLGTVEGCIFSNELFDALPFHRFKFQGGNFYEIVVHKAGDTLIEKVGDVLPGKLVSDLGLNLLEWEENQEGEYRSQVSALYENWAQILSRGFVATFDYGHPRAYLYSPIRSKGTWMCYQNHKTNQEILKFIGQQDITAHVDFTQLAIEGKKQQFDPLLFCTQGIFLTHVGAEIIEEKLKKGLHPGVVQQLVHPDSMGEIFSVFIQGKEVDLPQNFKSIPNRLRRLNWPPVIR
ncbi:MAG: class I SAM-dependent methyltransferase [Elusimicrobiota bacterium]